MRLPIFAIFCLIMQLGCNNPSDTPPPDSYPAVENNGPEPSAYSLTNEPLFPLEESDATRLRKDSLLQLAYTDYLNDSLDLENIIWYGRRLAYQYRYNEAIDVYTRGLVHHPNSAELYRHRGHRFISIRHFDKAVDDLKKAAALLKGRAVVIEPDGIPNRLNQPLSTLHFNVYYHWALAHYLRGEFDQASAVYDTCIAYSDNPDLLVATTDWYYMTLRRMGLNAKAANLLDPITDVLDIIENDSYHQRLLMYKGMVRPEELLDLSNDEESAQVDIVTQGYGVGNYYLYNDNTEKAIEVFKKILACDYWPAFGFIAAEADYQRLLSD